jgi:hypothetical protein
LAASVSIGILVCGLPGTNYFLEFRRAQAESVRKTVNEYGGLLTLGGVGVGGCAKKALAGTFTMPWLVAPSDLPGDMRWYALHAGRTDDINGSDLQAGQNWRVGIDDPSRDTGTYFDVEACRSADGWQLRVLAVDQIEPGSGLVLTPAT